MPSLKGALLWLFADRASGRIVIAQWPNIALWIALTAWAADRLAHPEGTKATVLDAVETTALIVWAGDEILRGVNPWRRLLGAAVLAGVALRRLT